MLKLIFFTLECFKLDWMLKIYVAASFKKVIPSTTLRRSTKGALMPRRCIWCCVLKCGQCCGPQYRDGKPLGAKKFV